SVSGVVVYGVEVPGTDGRAGMAAVTLKEGAELDGAALAESLHRSLPGYAVPLFVRVVEELEYTSTFKSRKVDLREQGYTDIGSDELFVLASRSEGFAPIFEGYVDGVARGDLPKP
ncbi:MAG: AMP-binding enzyme, partial [Rhodococcus sp. (in: high G+C Gram-positive bacteria)]|uniref:AMP-binding enzyme n=2 Tax=unclassified Rhodococcus (in: high G+C Gram-positive bacteria) TaxID=192944 RepID=UPI003D9B70D8